MTDVHQVEGVRVPLARAALCLDCELVCDGGAACPVCGGEALLWLAAILGLMEHAAAVEARPE